MREDSSVRKLYFYKLIPLTGYFLYVVDVIIKEWNSNSFEF